MEYHEKGDDEAMKKLIVAVILVWISIPTCSVGYIGYRIGREVERRVERRQVEQQYPERYLSERKVGT